MGVPQSFQSGLMASGGVDRSVYNLFECRGITIDFIENLIHHDEILHLTDVVCILLERYPDGVFSVSPSIGMFTTTVISCCL